MPRRITTLLVALAIPIVLLWLLQATIGQAQTPSRNQSNLVFAQWDFEDQTTNPNIDLTPCFCANRARFYFGLT